MSDNLTLKNFDQTEIFKSLFAGKIDDLLDFCPSDSNSTSEITMSGDSYRGVLKIISSQGKFVVEAVSQDLDGMIKTLFQLMHRKLTHWRKLRFQFS